MTDYSTTTYVATPRTSYVPRGGMFFGGLGLVFRNWRCLTWAYFINLVFAIIGSLPWLNQISGPLGHSMEASKIAGPLDMGALATFSMRLMEHPSGGLTGAIAMDVLFVLVLFILTPGIIAIYMSDEPASLGNMLRTGLRYFWRFVRLMLVGGLIMAIVYGGLVFLRMAVTKTMDNAGAAKINFEVAVVLGVLIWAVIAAIRLWIDLAEVVTVDRGAYRLGQAEDRRSVRALGPGLRLLKAGFARLYVSSVAIGALGWAMLILCLLVWRSMSPYGVFRGFLLGQIGLFLLLFTRFWQRGLEVTYFMNNTALVTPIAVPLVAPPVYVAPPIVVTPVVPVTEPVVIPPPPPPAGPISPDEPTPLPA